MKLDSDTMQWQFGMIMITVATRARRYAVALTSCGVGTCPVYWRTAICNFEKLYGVVMECSWQRAENAYGRVFTGLF